MKYETIAYQKDGGIATLTFNRPQVLNASNDQMELVEVPAAVDEARDDDEVRVLIVTGAGRGFHAGDDMRQTVLAEDRDRTSAARKIAELRGLPKPPYFDRFYKPIIAAVNGPAVGGGFDIALSCDFRIASEKARFGYFFVRRGLMGRAEPLMMLVQMVGLSKALEITLTGEMIEADEAARLGLVSRVVPADRLMDEARGLAARLTKVAPLAQQAVKRAIHKALFNPTALSDLAAQLRAGLGETEDHLEGARAFMEKREPIYRGR